MLNITSIRILLVVSMCLPNGLVMSQPESGTSETVVKQQSALDERIRIEQETRFQQFVLTPHKPNYLLPITYNSLPNQAPFDPVQDGVVEKSEVKFQISIKSPITDELFGEGSTLYAAYTNKSFWQAYNNESSHPFREANHEPELFLAVENDWQFMGFTNKVVFVGISHESNGQSGAKSRSWNRIYADFIFEKDNFYLSFKPWYRVEPPDVRDDNPDILHYMGHGELRMAYATDRHTVAVRLRNNLKADNRGAVELNWSFPMSRRAKWFMQYFDGYGESLIDYNARVKRFGIGVALTDWL